MSEEPVSEKSGWEDETEIHAPTICDFLSGAREKKYDSLSELHYSGGNHELMQHVMEGTAQVHYAKMYYENGQPNHLHVVFNTPGKEHGFLDVYIKGRALDDYLSRQ